MVLEAVECPTCGGVDIYRHGQSATGKKRYICRDVNCTRNSFILDYTYQGYLPRVKQQIEEMAINGSGIRDTGRVLGISPTTVIKELKKKEEDIEVVNYPLLEQLDIETLDVDLYEVEEAEMDEMWSFVDSKKQQRWLWHAIDHATGAILAYVLAPHKDQALVELVNLLKPFGIKRFFTDAWGAYERILDPETHMIGKKNTQKIERKHLTLRTRIKRLARKTICFSKSILMHDIVIGLFINRYEFCTPS
jgi:IS1 family transposase/transposase-like protein